MTFKVTFQGHPQDESHTAAARPMAPPTMIPIVLPTEQGYHPHHISPLQTRRTPAQVKGVIKQQIFKTSKKCVNTCLFHRTQLIVPDFHTTAAKSIPSSCPMECRSSVSCSFAIIPFPAFGPLYKIVPRKNLRYKLSTSTWPEQESS